MSIGDICPCPLEENDDPISQFDDKEQVNQQPAQPSEESAQLDHLKVGNRFVPTDRGHTSLVPILERCRDASHRASQDIAARLFSRLHRKRSTTRKRFPALMRKIGDITDGENLRMPWNTEVLGDDDPALTIGFS